ncbi:hypothetical protein BRADI_3g47980v3 [Brachypodium distachyon]|uniref:Remorin C-terminal domain-containing protein n=1 Tax=Brachypodium distachyon TaxID=15368 RepID=A0A2K2D3Y2_BRADI|nr:hypothetical protein BRADI_3g47980v3 [Brachypodium distachyon]
MQGARRLSSGADDGLLLPSASSRNGIRRSTWRSAGGDVPLPALLVAAVLGEQDEMRRVSERQRCVPLSLRDVGTEMTPGGSKEPSRANTPRAHVPSPGRFAAVATSRRYRREELKIQARENRARRKAQLQMNTELRKRMQRAQEKAAGKLAATQAVAKEKRARAEAKLDRRVAMIRGETALLGSGRRPRLQSSLLSLKLPLLCS